MNINLKNIFMKKMLYSILVVILLQSTLAQDIQFERVLPPPPNPQIIADFISVRNGGFAFADVDNDGDVDFVITGLSTEEGEITKLYLNDGIGNYSESFNTSFTGFSNASVAFADIDNDNDLDLFITGYSNNEEPISKLYTNDGSGNFTEVANTPFVGTYSSSIAFSDIDNDGNQDILITGYSDQGKISKLYANDGSGNFTEVINTTFTAVSDGSIAFADIDNDGDQDVLITGYSDQGRISKLYTNDGSGSFTEVLDTTFTAVSDSSVAFSDVDNDGDQDVLITGYSDQGKISKLYFNDGNENFVEANSLLFIGVSDSSVAFSDVDNDGDQDVLITGYSDKSEIAKLYTNDGNGNFTEVFDTPFIGVSNSFIAFVDINGDNNQDVFISGYFNKSIVSTLFVNDGSGNFMEVKGSPFIGIAIGSVAFSDIDNDGDQDVLVTGYSIFRETTKLYINDGSGNFTEVADTPFLGVSDSSIAFLDVDNDGDQDVLITGYSDQGRISKLYFNDGNGNFTEVLDTTFTAVSDSSVAFSDVDNDGDQDILITGYSDQGKISNLYTNDGSGNFTEITDTPFVGVSDGSVAFSDIDNDGDQDVLITGYTDNSDRISKLYTNDGSGNFTEVTDTPFVGVSDGSVAFSDIDNDGDQDILITGYSLDYEPISKLYLNNGNNNFVAVTNTPFVGVMNSSIAFADVDNDGDMDVFISGNINTNPKTSLGIEISSKISSLYLNDGTGNFTEFENGDFEKVDYSFVAFADIDNDQDQDLLVTGYSDTLGFISFLYRNLYDLLGITENQNVTTNLKVYPNPGSNLFTLDCNSQSIEDINIYNLQGQEMPFIFDKIQQTIQVNYPKGIYLIKLKINDKTQTIKIIVQ